MSTLSQLELEGLFPTDPLPAFVSPSALRRDAAQTLLPPLRIKVSEASEKYRIVNNPGAYVGPWRNNDAPYMVKPMDLINSRDHEAVIFVGPAQSFKTSALVENVLVHTIACAPRRTRIIEKSQDAARRFSRERMRALDKDCTAIALRKSKSGSDDNIHDKRYNGMTVEFGWPSVNWLSGDPIPLILLTDYDRFIKDVGGEGEPFDLARKRNATFHSLGMTMAESSPSKPILKADWKRKAGSNEAPPVDGGILSLYNRGDRHRLYWPCPQCGEFFEPDFSRLRWDVKEADIEEAAETVIMECPANGCLIEPASKPSLLALADWLPEGQVFLPDGSIRGDVRRSRIASFWLKGPAAAAQSWQALVRNYLIALEEFDRTGNEGPLQSTTNIDQAMPYLPKSLEKACSLEADALRQRAEDYPLGVVPSPGRFLTAWIDVQIHYFDVQVQAWGAGGRCWVIDKHRISRAEDGERLLDPAQFDEDWLPLIDGVISKAYPLAGQPGRVMQVKVTGIDLHGAPGVSSKALDFWRLCRRRGLGQRLRLTRGDGGKNAPRVAETYPDSQRKDRHAGNRGEVPVLNLNVNLLKDEVLVSLGGEDGLAAKVHFAADLADLEDIGPGGYFAEVASEARTSKGWERKNRRNEAWDQLVANRALWLWLKADRINWAKPPGWAGEWDSNVLVMTAGADPSAPVKAAASSASRMA